MMRNLLKRALWFALGSLLTTSVVLSGTEIVNTTREVSVRPNGSCSGDCAGCDSTPGCGCDTIHNWCGNAC